MTTILLGPQRFVTTVGPAVRALGVDGPIAVINAGWEERESDDGELNDLLDGRAVNLRLHHRMFDVVDTDERFRAAALAFRDRHDELRAFYGLRIQAAMDAVEAVMHRTSTQGLRDSALVAAIESVRDVDRWYAAVLKDLYRELDTAAPPDESAQIGWHRGEIEAILRDCAAVVLPGGHVGTLLRALRLFRVALPADRPVVAWSAGAMALTDKVVLFHDFAPQGVARPSCTTAASAACRARSCCPTRAAGSGSTTRPPSPSSRAVSPTTGSSCSTTARSCGSSRAVRPRRRTRAC